MPGENLKMLPLRGLAGIKKDGTETEGQYWSDGIWSRFYRGLPRSMLGYRSMSEDYHGTSRGMQLYAANGLLNITSGTHNRLEVAQFSKSGVGSSPSDRTPAGFVGDNNNVWQMDAMFTTNGGGFTALMAHGAPNLANIDSSVAVPIYYGDITTTTALTSAGINVSGGVCFLNPFAVSYGSQGALNVSAAGDPTSWPAATQFNICADKIVKILPIRGGAYAPSGLIWSLGSLLRMSFVGGATTWQFDTLSDSSSVLSSSAMIEQDGIYYWPGADRFLMYNGVLRELPNSLSLDFFYSNLNFQYQQKVFAYKVPRWGEICWCAPLFGATECNWMLVYNYRENTWYDTPLPTDGRSAALNPTTTFPFPILSSANGLTSLSGSSTSFPLWWHETGRDRIRGNETDAILSSITSPQLSIVGGGLVLGGVNMPGENVWTQTVRFEPDFLKNGNLKLYLLSKQFPDDIETSQLIDLDSGIEDIDKQGRYLRWKIECNASGNYYVLGQSLIHYRPGDRTP